MSAAQVRRPGRPRSEEAHEAILTAVIELLPEHGLKGLTIEAVAAAAGVGKTTIYRRWKTKNELIVAALAGVRPDAAPPDSGSLAGDLAAMVALQRGRLKDSSLPRVMPGVLGEAMDDPELHAQIVAHAVAPLREMLAAIACGAGRRALGKAAAYATERAVWGAPIGTHQGISHPLAEAKIDLELARLMLQKAAALYDAGAPGAGEASNMAKYSAAEAAIKCVDRAIQAHGGNGFALEYGLSDMWWGVRLTRTAPVSREMILNYVAEHSLGLPKSY